MKVLLGWWSHSAIFNVVISLFFFTLSWLCSEKVTWILSFHCDRYLIIVFLLQHIMISVLNEIWLRSNWNADLRIKRRLRVWRHLKAVFVIYWSSSTGLVKEADSFLEFGYFFWGVWSLLLGVSYMIVTSNVLGNEVRESIDCMSTKIVRWHFLCYRLGVVAVPMPGFCALWDDCGIRMDKLPGYDFASYRCSTFGHGCY